MVDLWKTNKHKGGRQITEWKTKGYKREGKGCERTILYVVKIFFKIEGKIKSLTCTQNENLFSNKVAQYKTLKSNWS